MKTDKLCVMVALSCLILTGCGGHGDDRPDFNPDRSLAQGVYDGTIVYQDGTDLRFNQQTIVLENGEFFIVYGETIEDVYFVDGVLNGTGQIAVGTSDFYSYDLNDYFFNRSTNSLDAVYSGRLVATFSSGSFFNGSARQRDSFVDFAGTVPVASVYDYNVAANLANVTGDWIMSDLLGSTLTLNVTGTGSITGIYANGCALSGTLTPRASGRNVFNATLRYGPTPCAQPNRSFSGVAIDYAPSASVRALVVSGVTEDRTEGTALYGTR
jgi:hypothetical protein